MSHADHISDLCAFRRSGDHRALVSVISSRLSVESEGNVIQRAVCTLTARREWPFGEQRQTSSWMTQRCFNGCPSRASSGARDGLWRDPPMRNHLRNDLWQILVSP
jgi:hypothetical protein